MSESEPLLRNVSDTARWVAVYRALESERPDAVFRDPFARRLAGERGWSIAATMPDSNANSWAFVARTFALDAFVAAEVDRGVDLVVNLAAGLDSRPYRLDLPPSLRWVEVDLPEILDYKEGVLRGETPRCSLERVRADLSDADARRAVLARLGASAKRALVITEGLLIYLEPAQVDALARDLAAVPSFERWALDLASPGLMKMLMKKDMGAKLVAAGAPFKFAPAEGEAWFGPRGWTPVEVISNLKTGAELRRLPFFLKLISLLPERSGPKGRQPWSGNCLFERTAAR